MMDVLNQLHSILRWVILILLVLTIVKSFQGMRQNEAYSASDKKFALWTLIVAHLQLVIGLVQYFVGGKGLHNIQTHGMGDVMKSSVMRFYAVEHIFVMLIAIILITVGYSTAKRVQAPRKKNKKIFIFYLIALILILSRIPWPFMKGFENTSWF
jgi:L-asparagine transporter-like permease